MTRPSWAIRRRIVVATLLFCALEVIYLTGWGEDTELHSSIATSLIILAGSVVGSYVFGAVWDDKNVMAMSRRPRRRPPPTDGDDDADPSPPPGYAG